ncbi:MAG TPA: tRNA (uridine(34)/cytosine(34)/5-carboxymethylaminomethyluridine(34)-2'-O)-methyltransferase TrmL [Clostridiaceae bacterium]|nr:tRNA (uridine(34)/cytosine(34)/5-carboxymethylaminomethyluridine(34)-2'-O)-methyltransferase TrmL [Clostridiaceae bacterium]
MSLNIVLVEPEIPQNTGNIARTCAAVGANLHLVRPLGFSVEDRYLKRAGLDYWDWVNIQYYDSFNEVKNKYSNSVFYYSTTKALKSYAEVSYSEDCFIVFGKETAGLPEELLKENKDFCIRIPMKEGIRSLNLSNSVAIIVYEALRQHGFKGLVDKGKLTRYAWE